MLVLAGKEHLPHLCWSSTACLPTRYLQSPSWVGKPQVTEQHLQRFCWVSRLSQAVLWQGGWWSFLSWFLEGRIGAGMLSRLWLFATQWTVCSPSGSSVHGISQKECLGVWGGVGFWHFLLHRIVPNSGMELHFLHQKEYSLPLSHLGSAARVGLSSYSVGCSLGWKRLWENLGGRGNSFSILDLMSLKVTRLSYSSKA